MMRLVNDYEPVLSMCVQMENVTIDSEACLRDNIVNLVNKIMEINFKQNGIEYTEEQLKTIKEAIKVEINANVGTDDIEFLKREYEMLYITPDGMDAYYFFINEDNVLWVHYISKVDDVNALYNYKYEMMRGV